MGLNIGVKAEWVKKDGNCEPCINCLQPIYGNRYNMEIAMGTDKRETKLNLCESCYDKTMNDEDI